MKKFAIIGVAGYIAPRHLQAIKETNNQLVAAVDISDSVGILDKYFPDSEFFTDYEEFLNFLENNNVDYVSICSPNYLHMKHIIDSLAVGCDVICEKPLVLTTSELAKIRDAEIKYGKKVFSILQLRLHPTIMSLKNELKDLGLKKQFEVDLRYITCRGNWYQKSWKGDIEKSGGLSTNIGVHFFDMLHHLFGKLVKLNITHQNEFSESGLLVFERANVNWYLSIDFNDLPKDFIQGEKKTYRSIKIEDKELEFSTGFDDLHNESYRKVLMNKGFGIEETEDSLKIIEMIRLNKK